MKKLSALILALAMLLYAVPAPAEQDPETVRKGIAILENGIKAYTQEDFATALEAFNTCVDMDLTEGYHCLAYLYLYGLGVDQSYDRALELLNIAADRGYHESQCLLGILYLEGQGVEKNRELALEYLLKAAAQGHERAREILDAVPQEGSGNYTDQLRRKAVDFGMTLPEPGEGERLYLGYADVPDTHRSELYVALIASPNLMKVRAVVIFGHALEARAETGNMYEIDTSISTRSDYWLNLKADTRQLNFSFDDDDITVIRGLTLDENGGSCFASRGNTYTDESSGELLTYYAGADITLYNLTGAAALEPVDPPTAGELKAAGMELPEAGEGETLFIGRANPSQAEAAYVVFILTADGQCIRNPAYLLINMTAEYETATARVKQSVSSSSATVNNTLALADHFTFSSFSLSEFTVDGDTASCIFSCSVQSNDGTITYPLDPARVRFANAE